MKTISSLLIFILSTSICLCQETFPINGVENNYKSPIAFINAKIHQNSSKVIENGMMLVQDDKILNIGDSVTIPKNAIIKDLNGDFIYPSFIELISDFGIQDPAKTEFSYTPQYESKKTGPYHWNQSVKPEVNASSIFKYDEDDAKKYINNGFGIVLSHQNDGIFRGNGTLVIISEKRQNQTIIEDKAATFYSFSKGVSRQRYPTSLMGSIALFKQTLLDAQWYEQTNKKELNLSLESYNQNKFLPKIFILNNETDYYRLFSIADEFEIDFIVKGNGKEFAVSDQLKKFNFPLVIPLNFPSAYDISNPVYTDWLSLKKLKEWELAPYNLNIIAKNKIPFAITSSDLKNKKNFLKNLRIAINHGLKKEDALKALTETPAKLINKYHLIGSIEAGKKANFIICSNDIFIEGDIYENWVDGERNVIKEKNNEDIRGYYTFNSTSLKDLFVEINGDIDKPKIKIPSLDSSWMSSNLKYNKLTFFSNQISFRAICKINSGIGEGRAQTIEGTSIDFVLTKDSSIVIKNKKTSNSNIDTVPPNQLKPNVSYGFEKLPKKKDVVLKNGTIWTNEKSGVLNRADIAFSNGKIVFVGKNIILSDVFSDTTSVQIIDATEKHITSGIIDEHSHIAISRGVNESSQAVTAEVSIGDVINSNDVNIYRHLAGGVTAAQLLHGSANPIGGQSALVKMRWGSLAEEMKIKSDVGFIKFALGENVKQSNWGAFNTFRFPQTRMGVEQVFYDAFFRAKNYKKEWDEYNKLSLRKKRNTPPPREDIELNILSEILDKKRFITCHSYVQSEINMLMHVGDSMGFTVNTFTHILEGYKVADKMKKHGAGGSTFSDWWAYKFEVNDAIPHNAALLNNAGVVTAINSDDAEMGRRLNHEAAKAIKYGGVSKEDAWKMITLNPAKLLKLDKKMGSLKVGKDADIVIWSDEPLSIYAKVESTFVDGRLLFDHNYNEKLMSRDQKEKARIISKMATSRGKKQKIKFEKEDLYHCCKHRSINYYE